MVVGTICVVLLIAGVCIFSHCWKHILGSRGKSSSGAVKNKNTSRSNTPCSTSSLLTERWLDPVCEWPQQIAPRRSRNNRKRAIYVC
ncbi:hypothetical protein M426DRAFT_320883 [Hypoxylon sp. CI-4A]|nr:hypothetical protein M426DRAFT_320883 [Hypoxylon sp. CI-4A]